LFFEPGFSKSACTRTTLNHRILKATLGQVVIVWAIHISTDLDKELDLKRFCNKEQTSLAKRLHETKGYNFLRSKIMRRRTETFAA